MLHNFFDQTYLINLDRRPDRLHSAKSECDRIGLPFQRVSAVDGSLENIKLTDELTISNSGVSWNAGAAGLILTVKKILEDSMYQGYESVLILEDDIVFHPDIIQFFQKWLVEIPRDWELIYLSTRHMRPFDIITNNIVRINFGLHTHCWAIHRNIFEPCIDLLKKMDLPLDLMLARDIQTRGKSYGFTMNLAHQTEGYSDIACMQVDFKD